MPDNMSYLITGKTWVWATAWITFTSAGPHPAYTPCPPAEQDRLQNLWLCDHHWTSSHDVQVLGELFNAIHRALLGSAAEKAADPQLPVKIRLNAQSQESKAVPNGVPGMKDAAAPQSLVQRLFGLQVQVCSHLTHMHDSSYLALMVDPRY